MQTMFTSILWTLWACLVVTCSASLSPDDCKPGSAKMLGWTRPECGSCADKAKDSEKEGLRCEAMSKRRYEECDVSKVKFAVSANLIYKKTPPSSLFFALRPHQVEITSNRLIVPFDVLVPYHVSSKTKLRLSVKKQKGFKLTIFDKSNNGSNAQPKSPRKLRVKHLVRASTMKFELAVNSDECRILRNVMMQVNMRQTRSKMVVTIEHSNCEVCDCAETERRNASECNYHGDYVCGKCQCHAEFEGDKCEPKKPVGPCTDPLVSNPAVCSGNGVCVDGHCACSGTFSGRYCQCDDFSCPKVNTSFCSGNGQCQCGVCICDKDYKGDMCECHGQCQCGVCMCDIDYFGQICECFIGSTANECWSPSGTICSNRGSCVCGQCQCALGYSGPHCSEQVDATVTNSSMCSYHGDMKQGQCQCYDRYSGDKCEIENKDHLCTAPYDTEVCSGRGECMDGHCECAKTFSGPYCECYDYYCSAANETACSGHGSCNCGQCECESGYTGNTCDCTMATESCKHMAGVETLCRNRGSCVCGQCECEDGYMGTHCGDFKLPTPMNGVGNNVFPLYIESTRYGDRVEIITRHYPRHGGVKLFWKLGIEGASPVITKGEIRVDTAVVFSTIFLKDSYKYDSLRVLVTSTIGDIDIGLDVDALMKRNQNGNLPNYRVNIGVAKEVAIPETGPLTVPIQMLLSDEANYLDEFAVNETLLIQGTKAEIRYLQAGVNGLQLITKTKVVQYESTAESKKLVYMSVEFTEDELREIDNSIELRVYFELDVDDLDWSFTYQHHLTESMVVSRYSRLLRAGVGTGNVITNTEDTVYFDLGIGYKSVTCTAFGYPKPPMSIGHTDPKIGPPFPTTDIMHGSSFMASTMWSLNVQINDNAYKGVYTCIAGPMFFVSESLRPASKNITVVQVDRPSITVAKVQQKTSAKLKVTCEATGTPKPTVKFVANSVKDAVAIGTGTVPNKRLTIRDEVNLASKLRRTMILRNPPKNIRRVYCVAESCVPGPDGCTTVTVSELARKKKKKN